MYTQRGKKKMYVSPFTKESSILKVFFDRREEEEEREKGDEKLILRERERVL